jgi:hypothetical protein
MTDTASAARTRAPWHLWVLGLLGLLWSCFGAFDHLMAVTRNEAYLRQPLKGMVDCWLTMPAWVFVVWGIGLAGAVPGCTGLLMRRRWAVPGLGLGFLLSILLLSILSLVLGLSGPVAPRMEGMEIMAAFILGTLLLLLVYAILKSRRGILT